VNRWSTGEADNPRDLLGHKRLSQNIVSAKIQYFGPQPVIGKGGRDDQSWWAVQRLELCQHARPVAVRESGIADHKGELALREQIE
jgi:hypothetical protein